MTMWMCHKHIPCLEGVALDKKGEKIYIIKLMIFYFKTALETVTMKPCSPNQPSIAKISIRLLTPHQLIRWAPTWVAYWDQHGKHLHHVYEGKSRVIPKHLLRNFHTLLHFPTPIMGIVAKTHSIYEFVATLIISISACGINSRKYFVDLWVALIS